jgi:osmotically-inducible protein OsmY
MKRLNIWIISTAVSCGLTTLSPAMALPRDSAPSPYPSRYSDHYEISARDGMLIGGKGTSGDSMRYQGSRIWRGPGAATVLVDERNNTGIVMGTIHAKGHTYTVLMDRFSGKKPFQSGGIARFVELHGLTNHGAPILPKTFAYLAGWGSPCTVWKDADVMYGDFACHFMVTETVREPDTGHIEDFPDKTEISQLLKGTQWQGDYRENRRIRREIARSADSNQVGLQLHLIAHSQEREISNVPPYGTAMHFMWNDVQWWSGPQQASPRAPNGWLDHEITQMIQRELEHSEIINPEEIDVSVRNGRVTLNGTVESAIEKNHAYFSAWVAGVKAVRNHISVSGGEEMSDRDLRQALLQAFALDPRIVHSRPDVRVKDGVVTLEGAVPSSSVKRAAAQVARQFAGPGYVQNRLKIDESLAPSEATARDSTAMLDIEPVPGLSEDDWKLKRDIDGELTWSPFVDADNVTVTVRDGVAYLSGTVETRDEMEAAIDNAYDAGADRVTNYMIIDESS